MWQALREHLTNSVLIKPLREAIARIDNPVLLFVIVIVLIISFVFVPVLIFRPQSTIDFFVTLGAILVLAVVALVLFGLLWGSGNRDMQAQTTSEDCQSLKAQLEAAKKVLSHLRIRANKFPDNERPVTLDINIREHEILVQEVTEALQKCLSETEK